MLNTFFILILTAFITFICGCTNNQSTIPLKATIQSVYYLNPNAYNRPSPVVVTILQLKNNTTFNQSDFFALYNHTSSTLGNSLIDKEQTEIRPNHIKSLNIKLSKKANYIGIIAAYHNTNKSNWRRLITLPSNCKSIKFNIELQSQGLVISNFKNAKFCINSKCFFKANNYKHNT